MNHPRLPLWLAASAIVAFVSLSVAPAAAVVECDRFVEAAPGVRIHLVDAGASTAKPTLVLIPGWRLTVKVWREQIATFARDRRVIAIDPRSQGDSTKTPEGDTPEQRARDLHAVLAQLKPGPIVLVGWSQGVQDVAAYVAQFGVADLKGVVLVDSTVSAGSPGVASAPQAAAQQLQLLSLFSHNPREASVGMMQAIIRKPLTKTELDQLVDDALKTPTAIGAAMLADDLFGPDRTPALAKLVVPTLVIASENSQELEAQRTMAGNLPRGQFVVMANTNHAVFIDQPARFDALLAAFMAPLK